VESYEGDLFADPARFFAAVVPTDTFSTDYTFNPYLNRTSYYTPESGAWATSALGDVSIYLPSDALSVTAAMTVTYHIPAIVDDEARIADETFALVDRPFAFDVRLSDGAQPERFNRPATIEAFIDPVLVEERDFVTTTLQIMTWVDGEWLPLPTDVSLMGDGTQFVLRAFAESPAIFGIFAERNVPERYDIYLPGIMVQ
jgi:hypothetical protein